MVAAEGLDSIESNFVTKQYPGKAKPLFLLRNGQYF